MAKARGFPAHSGEREAPIQARIRTLIPGRTHPRDDLAVERCCRTVRPPSEGPFNTPAQEVLSYQMVYSRLISRVVAPHSLDRTRLWWDSKASRLANSSETSHTSGSLVALTSKEIHPCSARVSARCCVRCSRTIAAWPSSSQSSNPRSETSLRARATPRATESALSDPVGMVSPVNWLRSPIRDCAPGPQYYRRSTHRSSVRPDGLMAGMYGAWRHQLRRESS